MPPMDPPPRARKAKTCTIALIVFLSLAATGAMSFFVWMALDDTVLDGNSSTSRVATTNKQSGQSCCGCLKWPMIIAFSCGVLYIGYDYLCCDSSFTLEAWDWIINLLSPSKPDKVGVHRDDKDYKADITETSPPPKDENVPPPRQPSGTNEEPDITDEPETSESGSWWSLWTSIRGYAGLGGEQATSPNPSFSHPQPQSKRKFIAIWEPKAHQADEVLTRTDVSSSWWPAIWKPKLPEDTPAREVEETNKPFGLGTAIPTTPQKTTQHAPSWWPGIWTSMPDEDPSASEVEETYESLGTATAVTPEKKATQPAPSDGPEKKTPQPAPSDVPSGTLVPVPSVNPLTNKSKQAIKRAATKCQKMSGSKEMQECFNAAKVICGASENPRYAASDDQRTMCEKHVCKLAKRKLGDADYKDLRCPTPHEVTSSRRR